MSNSVVANALSDVDGFLLSLESQGYIAPKDSKRVGKGYVYGILFGEIQLLKFDGKDVHISEAVISKHIPFRPSVLHGICQFGNSITDYDIPGSRSLDSYFYLRLLSTAAPGLVDALWDFVMAVDDQLVGIRSNKAKTKLVTLDTNLIKSIIATHKSREKAAQKSIKSIRVPENLENAGLGKRKTMVSSVDIDKLPYFVYSMLSEGAKQAVIECLIASCLGVNCNPKFGKWVANDTTGNTADFVFRNDPDYIKYNQEIILACPDTIHNLLNQAVKLFKLVICSHILVGWFYLLLHVS